MSQTLSIPMCPDNYHMTFARGFRYDTPRGRYVNREFDPAWLALDPPQFVPESSVWRSYDVD